MPPQPKVDDQFWFDYSSKAVSAAIQDRDDAAEKIQRLALWLWGIYTGSAAVGFTLAGKRLGEQATILIASASAALIGVYWASVWTQMPIFVSFDPRSPGSIRRAYDSAVAAKRFRLHVTLAMSVFAAALVSVALMVASLSDTRGPDLRAEATFRDGKPFVAVAGRALDTTEVKIRIRPADPGGTGQEEVFPSLPSPSGVFEEMLPLKGDANTYEVTLEWHDKEGVTHSLSRTVKRPVKAPSPTVPAAPPTTAASPDPTRR